MKRFLRSMGAFNIYEEGDYYLIENTNPRAGNILAPRYRRFRKDEVERIEGVDVPILILRDGRIIKLDEIFPKEI